jgi:hypothetical protein
VAANATANATKKVAGKVCLDAHPLFICLYVCSSQKRKRADPNKGTRAAPEEIDSGDESDGQSALRDVETKEQGKGARRGPANTSLQHFREPVAVADSKGNTRWEFKCKYCQWSVTIVAH